MPLSSLIRTLSRYESTSPLTSACIFVRTAFCYSTVVCIVPPIPIWMGGTYHARNRFKKGVALCGKGVDLFLKCKLRFVDLGDEVGELLLKLKGRQGNRHSLSSSFVMPPLLLQPLLSRLAGVSDTNH